MIDVVSAVILRFDRQLLTQRRADQDFPFTWESPGGKVDPGESHEAALRRELLEEVGIGEPLFVSPVHLWEGEFHSPMARADRRHVRVYRYAAYYRGDQRPEPREGQGIGWFAMGEIPRLQLAPADQRALSSTLAHMRRSPDV